MFCIWVDDMLKTLYLTNICTSVISTYLWLFAWNVISIYLIQLLTKWVEHIVLNSTMFFNILNHWLIKWIFNTVGHQINHTLWNAKQACLASFCSIYSQYKGTIWVGYKKGCAIKRGHNGYMHTQHEGTPQYVGK